MTFIKRQHVLLCLMFLGVLIFFSLFAAAASFFFFFLNLTFYIVIHFGLFHSCLQRLHAIM